MGSRQLTPQQAANLVCETLDPLMVEFGFQEGQGGMDLPADVVKFDIVFCAPSDVFHLRLPRLAPHLEWGDGECTDVIVEVSCAPEWQLSEARLEGESITDLLARPGRDLGVEADALLGLPLHAAIGRLRALLRAAFEQTRSSRLDRRDR